MKPLVGIIMGSSSDWETMQAAAEQLDKLGVPYEVRVVSAHRTPDWLAEYAREAAGRGLRVIVAGAGGAAHLPGMTGARARARASARHTPRRISARHWSDCTMPSSRRWRCRKR